MTTTANIQTSSYHFDSPVQVAKDARHAIRAAFPGLKFSLTGSTGTGYGWLHMSWTDGPTDKAMESVTAEFNSRLGAYHHINASRSYSVAAEEWALTQIDYHEGAWRHPYDHDDGTYYTARGVLAETTF
jgi:hypothetical protein